MSDRMIHRINLPTSLLLLAITIPATAQDLLPAGTVDDAARGANKVIAIQDDPVIRRHAESMQRKLFRGAELIDDKQAVEKSLAGQTVIVYGTPAHAWLKKYKDRLPFRYQDGAVVIEGRRFEGEHLRVICAIRNPEDHQRRAVLFTAAKAEDIPIPLSRSVLPWEWVVADGARILAARWFTGPPLPVEEMLADLDELVAKIRSVHPATVKGLPPELEKAIENARGELSKPLRRDQFWLVLSRVVNALHDAHSKVLPPSSGEFLDMRLRWLGEGIIITEDAVPLRKGDRIVRLGAHSERQLLDLLRGVASSENDHWVRHRGEFILKDLGRLRPLKIATKATVPLIVERDGEQLKVRVPLAAVKRPSKGKPWVRFEIDEKHNLGVFVLDKCTNDELYRKTLKRFFAEVREKKISRIAVDLRRNGGGSSSVVNEFLRYLDVESYTQFGSVVRWSPEARKRQGSLLTLFAKDIERHAQRRVQNRRVDEPFRGQVFVLTSKDTFSSANWFAVMVQDNKIGKVLGEPTGNAPSAYGQFLVFELTHSGLRYALCTKQFFRPDPKRDPADTLTPDHVIPTTRRDLIDGRDAVLEFLRNQR